MTQLMTLEALGRELAAAATAGDWTRVLELDSARGEVLAGLPADGGAAVRAALEQALAVTREALARAEDARSGVAEELRGLRRGQRGAHAYHDQR
jgi:hypothetical protein